VKLGIDGGDMLGVVALPEAVEPLRVGIFTPAAFPAATKPAAVTKPAPI